MSERVSTIDPVQLRRTLGRFATGVLVVTTRWGDRIHGMTANAFTSVSLTPPLVLICIDQRAAMRQALQESGHYGLSVLSREQQRLSRHFSSRNSPEVEIAFEDLDGVPVIAGALAQFSCRIRQTLDAGDHLIFIGEVIGHRHDEGEPLLYFGGGYNYLQRPELRGTCQ
ncbi:flavin reductase family protein [Pseudochelatococcus sp. B33]